MRNENTVLYDGETCWSGRRWSRPAARRGHPAGAERAGQGLRQRPGAQGAPTRPRHPPVHPPRRGGPELRGQPRRAVGARVRPDEARPTCSSSASRSEPARGACWSGRVHCTRRTWWIWKTYRADPAIEVVNGREPSMRVPRPSSSEAFEPLAERFRECHYSEQVSIDEDGRRFAVERIYQFQLHDTAYRTGGSSDVEQACHDVRRMPGLAPTRDSARRRGSHFSSVRLTRSRGGARGG